MTTLLGDGGQLWLNGEPWPMGQMVQFHWEYDQHTLKVEAPSPEQRYWIGQLANHHQSEQISFCALIQDFLVVLPVVEPTEVTPMGAGLEVGFATRTPFSWESPHKIIGISPDSPPEEFIQLARSTIREAIELDRRFYPQPLHRGPTSDGVSYMIWDAADYERAMTGEWWEDLEVDSDRARCLNYLPDYAFSYETGLAACDRLVINSPLTYGAVARLLGSGVLTLAEDGLQLDGMTAEETREFFCCGYTMTAAEVRHRMRQRGQTPRWLTGIPAEETAEAASTLSNRQVSQQEIREAAVRTLEARREALRRWRYETYQPTPKHIGDITCVNNARSPYVRCAVNPCGPCEGCKDYEQRDGG